MSDALTTVSIAIGIIAAAYGGWRAIRPAFRLVMAALEAILGAEAVRDRGGEVVTPAQPGLVHRVTNVEEAVVEFRHMVGLLTETQHTLTEHGARIKALEDARVERLVSQAESAHMWRAVADNAVTDIDPE